MVKINMDMPSSCFMCPIRAIAMDCVGETYYSCGFVKEPIRDGRTEHRHKDCPLEVLDDQESGEKTE